MPLVLFGSPRGGSASSSSWLLGATHSIASSITMEIIHPRADASSQSYERHRLCPSALEWEYPVVVLGGRYPFRYELVAGPAGMTLGQYFGDSDYGILRWSNPTTVGSPHTVTVRVTDQDQVQTPVTFSLAVQDRESTTYFVFVDSFAGSNSNDGSYTSRKLDLVGPYGSSSADATHANKQVFLNGTFNVGGVSGLSYAGTHSQKLDWNNNKPKVLVALPGGSATFVGNSAYFELAATNGGACFSGIQLTGPTCPDGPLITDYTKRFAAGTSNSLKDGLAYDCHIVGTGTSPVESSNPACFFQRSGTTGGRFAISHCTFDDCDEMGWLLCYGGTLGVIQENDIANGYNAEGAIYFKGDPTIQYWSIRRNRATVAGVTSSICKVDYLADAVTRDNIEVSHNTWLTDGTPPNFGTGFLVGETDGSYGNNIRSFRNSYNCNYCRVLISTAGTISFINDAIQHDGSQTEGIEITTAARVEKTSLLTETSGVFDAGMLLTSTYNAQRGTHGAEIA